MNPLLSCTRVEIDLDRLRGNITKLREYVGKKIKLAAVIKADAYGHGAGTIAAELCSCGVEYLAVARLEEALELRQNNIASPILVMGYTDAGFFEEAVQNNATLTLFSLEQAKALSSTASRMGKTARVHIKLDTGFNRLGKKPTDAFVKEIASMNQLPGIILEGIFSHLRLVNETSDRDQFHQLSSFVEKLENRGVHFQLAHISDSIGAIAYPEFSLDMIRPGAIIYGYVPRYQLGRIDVEPIMSFKTKVTRVETLGEGEGVGYSDSFNARGKTVVATLAAGYADGYPRHLSNLGWVAIREKKAKVLGIICMDQMMVDVAGIPDVRVGDDAILFGPGRNHPSVEELSRLAKTNKNSIISGISRRIPRIYLKKARITKVKNYLFEGERYES